MKRIALMTLALATIVGTANADPVVADRAASKFYLFGAGLSVSMTGLPTFATGKSAFGQAINANGDVVGFGFTESSQRHAFYWSSANPTVLVDIDPFGGDVVQANGINDNGVVVGFKIDILDDARAFKWTAGTAPGMLTALAPLSGHTGSWASGINNSGQVVGWSIKVVGTDTVNRATLWQANNAPFDLGASLGSGTSKAQAINEAGQVVGEYTVNGELHAFVWTPGVGVTDLGTLGGGFSSGWDLNTSAWVVGESSDLDERKHAFLWGGSTNPLLDLEPDALVSLASGVNSTPHAVGFSMTTASRAVLWGPGGLRQDLGTLAGSGMAFGSARGINDNGQVVGSSSDGVTGIRPTVWNLDQIGPPPPDVCGTDLADQIQCLITHVESMESLGNKGRTRSLLAKLYAAKKQAGRQNEKAARNIVNAFTKQVHVFVLAEIMRDQDEGDIAAIIEGMNP